jgi:inhibitor of cysteine peptidase
MKKLLSIIGLLGIILVSCLAAGCGAEVKAYSDPDKAIEINAGTEFDIVISLESNPSTGYSWVAVYDQDELVLVDKIFTSHQGDEKLVGAGGTETFRFKAQKTGQATITMSYQRPWEATALETKVFNVVVK